MPPCGTPLVGWVHGVVPTSGFTAYRGVARWGWKSLKGKSHVFPYGL